MGLGKSPFVSQGQVEITVTIRLGIEFLFCFELLTRFITDEKVFFVISFWCDFVLMSLNQSQYVHVELFRLLLLIRAQYSEA